MSRTVLICTVGMSLLVNLKQKSDTSDFDPLHPAFSQKNVPLIVKHLSALPMEDRMCGAEINTIAQLLQKNWLALRQLFFLVSDTEEGRFVGEILKKYFEEQPQLTPSPQVKVLTIEDLQDQEPKKFKLQGLRNLVREIGKIVQQFGSDAVAIDATGGYKAQISIAVLVGQALGIPVYYKHEKFAEIIDFPPMPISLDFDLLGEQSDILSDLEQSKIPSSAEIGKLDDKLRVFVNEVCESDQYLYELNPLGMLYLTSFRLRYPKAHNLRKLSEDERKKPRLSQHHYPNGFMEFVIKVWEENEWIMTIKDLNYNGQKGILDGNHFYVEPDPQGKYLLGTFKSNFGARFRLNLSDESDESLRWAADHLNQKYNC
jgi:putative CRISPR-associated protein (TIGR02619 family)